MAVAGGRHRRHTADIGGWRKIAADGSGLWRMVADVGNSCGRWQMAADGGGRRRFDGG